jgi:hypothetical protein
LGGFFTTSWCLCVTTQTASPILCWHKTLWIRPHHRVTRTAVNATGLSGKDEDVSERERESRFVAPSASMHKKRGTPYRGSRASPASTDSASPHAYLVGLPAAEETRSLKLNGCQMDCLWWSCTVCGGLATATWLQLGTAGIGPRMWRRRRVRIDDP